MEDIIYPFKYELFKVLKIISQTTYEIVLDTSLGLDYLADNIIDIRVREEKSRPTFLKEKVVKEGVLKIKIIYCDLEEQVRYQFSRSPFRISVDIAEISPEQREGLIPDHGQNQEFDLEDIMLSNEVDYRLIDCRTIDIKAVLTGELWISEWVEEKLKVCKTNLNYFYQISPRVSYSSL